MSQNVLDYLNSRTDASEAVVITTYSVYIGNREVLVTLRDQGDDAGATRYAASAELAQPDVDEPDAGRSNGNPDSTIVGALDNIHWWNFKTQ